MSVINITSENFEREVLQAQKPVLVDFWAPWCVYCRRLGPVIDRMAENSDGSVVIAKLNVDDAQDIAARYHVDTIPTLYLFQNGQPGGPLVAPPSQAQIDAWIAAQRG